MNTLFLILMLAVTLFISWWNARICGRHWSESKALGGFSRVLMWCGAIQSAVGFSMLILLAELGIAAAFDKLPPQAMQGALSLWYLVVIIPIIGTGTIIMVHSWQVAWRERSWGNAGVAAWNTYANVSNIIDATSAVPDAFDKVGELFKGGDEKSLPAKLVLLLVVVSLVGGALLTMGLINHYDRRARIEAKPVAA